MPASEVLNKQESRGCGSAAAEAADHSRFTFGDISKPRNLVSVGAQNLNVSHRVTLDELKGQSAPGWLINLWTRGFSPFNVQLPPSRSHLPFPALRQTSIDELSTVCHLPATLVE
jgi:hypothetical protein